ncbi:unnamed protein product [Thlaspi arvense]|uniref:Protein kinase domain-containing protein n=1 Tax=Thlaspi arvense TaxID=13288 RepID=A0AAU9RB68_THLAR|nr:unnamed protein product [Thlaspi arvense]
MGNCLDSSAKVDSSSHSPHANSASSASKVSSKTSRSTIPSGQITSSYSTESSLGSLPTLRTEGEILSSPNLKAFSFNELKNATKNFRPDSLLGEGGFGCVFKGWIDETTLNASRPGSGIVVAVKKLKPEGFQGGAQPLTWAIRMKVAVGAAKGLTFLHESKSQVIYRDFKAANILLDAEFNAKLSDFGLAKAGPTGDNTHVSTKVMGTQGYAAPEYIATGGQYPQKGAFAAASLALQCLNPEAKLRPKMSEVLVILEQLESAAKPGGKHTQMESPRARHSSSVQKSPVRYSQDRPLLHMTPGASPLPSYNQSPRVR